MADKQISDLVAATSGQTSDLFVLEQSGTAKKLTGQILVNYLTSIADGHGGIASITWQTSGTSGDGQYHYATIHYADTTTSTFTIRDGLKGDTGNDWYVYIKYSADLPTSDADIGTPPITGLVCIVAQLQLHRATTPTTLGFNGKAILATQGRLARF